MNRTEQETFAANAYAELVHEIERKGAIASDRVKRIVAGHLGLRRVRRKRIDPILQRGVDKGIWDWVGEDRNPFDLQLVGTPDPVGEDYRVVTCSEELEEYDALLEAGDYNGLDNWRRDNPVPEEEKDEPCPFGGDSTLTAALKEAGLLTEGAPPLTMTEATVLVTETTAPEVEEPVPVRKDVLDYTLRELLDAVLAHVGGK
jgi:hypothetical protein